jgi:MinD-like ATPase involved in chromosome partitioning or flagellar assembly
VPATEAKTPVGAPCAAPATEADRPVDAPSAALAAEVRLRVSADSVGVPGSMAVTARAAAARSASTAPPVVTVRADAPAGRPLNVVERALRNPAGGWRDHVVVVPGGHRPGKPDHTQRDQARARLPLPGPARIIVLGTTAGAGQTVTTLLTGQLLASLRGEAVAVLDFARQPGSLTELARQVPRLLPSRLAAGEQAASHGGSRRKRGLQVVTADHSGPGPRDADTLIEAVVARYPITLADPDAADVPRALQVADQLVLVTPVGEHSAGSLGMTLEWLDAHGHGRLAQAAITVLNGVSEQTAPYTGRAIGVATGRCRAIVRVPWDSRLAAGGALDTATVHAYTSLAGALISGLADAVPADSSGAGSASR